MTSVSIERPPVATALYALTERGAALVPTLDQLTIWGYPMLLNSPATDEFRLAWAGALIRARLRDAEAGSILDLSVKHSRSDETAILHLRVDGSIHLLSGGPADFTIEGEIGAIWPYLTDGSPSDPAGLKVSGDRRPLDRLRAMLADSVSRLEPAGQS